MFSLSKLCFLCLNNLKDLKGVLIKDKNGLIVEEKLYNLLSKKIQLKANIPKYVCMHCLKNLNELHNFKEKCLQNIDVLNSYLELLTTGDRNYKKLSIDLSKKSVEEWDQTKDQTTTTTETIIKSEIEDVDIEETEMTCLLFKEEKDVKTEVLFDDSLENSRNKEQTPDEFKNTKLPPKEKNISSNNIFEDEQNSYNNDIHNSASGNDADVNVDNDDSNKTYARNKEQSTKLPTREKNISLNNILEDIVENFDNDDSDSDETYVISNDENLSDSSYSECSESEYNNIRNRRSTNSNKRKSTRNSQTETIDESKQNYTENIPKYKCQICSKTFSNEMSLESHLNNHNKQEIPDNYECLVCFKKFNDELLLVSHLPEHINRQLENLDKQDNNSTATEEYSCEICCKIFQQKSLLLLHLREHVFEQTQKIIDKKNSQKRKIENSTEAPLEKCSKLEYECKKCGKKYSNKLLLVMHNARHKKQNQVENDSQKNQLQFEKPLLYSHNNEISSEDSTEIAVINNQQNNETKSEEKAVNKNDCPAEPICRQKPLLYSYLNNEIRSEVSIDISVIHNQQNNKTNSEEMAVSDNDCQANKKFFKEPLLSSQPNEYNHEIRSEFSSNLTTIHNPQNIATNSEKEAENDNNCQTEKYKCQICFDTFIDELLLHSHQNKHNNEIRSETSDSKEYKCFICLKIFFEESLLKLHLNTHCNKEKIPKKSVKKQNSTSINQIQQIIKNQDNIIIEDQDTISQDNKITRKSERRKITKNSSEKQNKSFNKQNKNFKCKFCDKSYPTVWSLYYHGAKHEENYKVGRRDHNITKRSRKDITVLNIAEKSETDSCLKELSTDNGDNLKGNNEKNSSEPSNDENLNCLRNSGGRLKCSICKMSFFLIRNLIIHLSAHKDAIQCEECKQILLNEDRLISHKRKHTGERPFRCEICHRGFRDESIFERHKICHTEPKFICDQCGKKFVLEDLLKKHKMYHESPKYICDLCGKEYFKKDAFESHMAAHAGERPHKCKHCPKSYPLKTSLATHMLSHKGEASFKCEICDKKFHFHHKLKLHKAIHFDDRPFECEHCKKRFKLKFALTTHLQRHRGERKYKCHICSKKLVSQECLKRHIMIHEGVKPYKCDKCDYATENLGNFRMHQDIHNGIKKHACDKCDYKTANISNLKTHQKQHEKGRNNVKKGVKKSNNKSAKKSKKRIIESESETSEESSFTD